MSKQEELWEKLDSEFDHILLDMKPYVLRHPSKTERQHCAIWIKKLCDPTTCGSGVMDRKNRNMYAHLLLSMLKRGILEGPFTAKPEPGKLKTLPTYMSIYFDEPLSGRSAEQSNRGLPDWVTGELSGCADESLAMDLLKDRSGSTPITAHHRWVTTIITYICSFCLQTSCLDTGIIRTCIENPRYLREKPSPLSPVSCQGSFVTEMKIKLLEAKHQEEKLKMQQRHDADVEKILDRKNLEIEEIKSVYRVKQKESEEMSRKLEKKVQSVLRESQIICESKEKQIAELKKLSDQSADSIKNEWEKKLHATVAEMEQEKFEMQRKHTENIQELLDDTNRRLAKMESEHNTRSQANEKIMHELELRVKQQSVELEKANDLRRKVTQEKARLEIHIASLGAELQETNKRMMMLQKEKEQQSEQQEEKVMNLLAKHETDMSHLHQEHALSAAKASEMIEILETTVAQFKQQLQESEYRRQQQVRDQEMKFQQEKDDLQACCEKKQERTRLQQQHSAEKDNLVQEHQREASSLERQARATLQQHQQHAQEWRKHDAQTVSDLEAQVSTLHDELQQAHEQHKQKLAEMVLLQEEERQKATHAKEAAMQQLRSDMERMANDLKKSHQQEMDANLEKELETATKQKKTIECD
uniref:Centrosomal protein 112 n=1 Tax=Xiphophorus couchianus TaxID=32473 RepID=A0A3B5M0X0_9TELE